ncbi:MAG: large-conductance mechanosensitive channel protein MscL [Chitinophagales bacterium]|nr:large-conductance mechanosensitive channel protein MscL [Chitinophagales bacterium]
MMKEFKEFAMKGSLIDLAVGFVMGAAFTKVTGAFINGMVMPLVGMIQGKDLSDWKLVLKDADKVAGTEEVAIKYGTFISVTIEFIIVAFVMFMVIKAINRMKKKQEEAPAAPPEPSTTDKLLMEIRDSLKK